MLTPRDFRRLNTLGPSQFIIVRSQNQMIFIYIFRGSCLETLLFAFAMVYVTTSEAAKNGGYRIQISVTQTSLHYGPVCDSTECRQAAGKRSKILNNCDVCKPLRSQHSGVSTAMSAQEGQPQLRDVPSFHSTARAHHLPARYQRTAAVQLAKVGTGAQSFNVQNGIPVDGGAVARAFHTNNALSIRFSKPECHGNMLALMSRAGCK